jgi:hypothetical protein
VNCGSCHVPLSFVWRRPTSALFVKKGLREKIYIRHNSVLKRRSMYVRENSHFLECELQNDSTVCTTESSLSTSIDVRRSSMVFIDFFPDRALKS